MTLIQTVFTKDRVIQVSDRRLSNGGKLVDDYYTKLVLWNDRYTVGFTGQSRIDRRQKLKTARWIADTLSGHGLFEDGVSALRAEAEKRTKKLPKNWDLRLAIVLAGFDDRDGPVAACVTNMDLQTNRSAEVTRFAIDELTIPAGHHACVHSIGATMNAEQKMVLEKYVPKALGKDDGLNPAVRLMVDLQRRVSKTDKKKSVGMDALCVHIPRGAHKYYGHGLSVMSNLGGPSLPTAMSSFGYFDRSGWQWKQEAPYRAGMGQVSTHSAWSDPDHPDNQTITFTISRPDVKTMPPGHATH
ncbi:hypothetical protein [Mycolicibacterium llatzerense]|uniref:hypothetical protein n=1 Tax=Mycolicibacterium llatzerense TaxID=280871 RepID=UPI0005C44A4C|nr:hypothetical protein [Mycolicibacterium llatzerense]MCT7371449.1 hypothetical protein [Mycolicibacterium llatzerense]